MLLQEKTRKRSNAYKQKIKAKMYDLG